MPKKKWVNEAGMSKRKQGQLKAKQERFKQVMRKRKGIPLPEEENEEK